MKIFHGIESINKISNAIVTSGTFDGVHIGHRKIISRINQLAKSNHGESVVITFDPHPRTIIFPDDNGLKLLTTLEEKIELLEKAGVQNLIIINFTKDFSRTSSQDWIERIIFNKIGVHTLVIGYDHHFGRNREGNIIELRNLAQKLGFYIEEIPAQDIDDIKVSSTKIRNALQEGNITLATQFLTYPYMFYGKVVAGDKLGRTIGFPTANLAIDNKLKLVPADGVYAINISLHDKIYKGMLNIGVRPTIDGKIKTIEANIFNFNDTIYNENLKIELIQKIRNEKKFESIEELKIQLEEDAKIAFLELNK